MSSTRPVAETEESAGRVSAVRWCPGSGGAPWCAARGNPSLRIATVHEGRIGHGVPREDVEVGESRPMMVQPPRRTSVASRSRDQQWDGTTRPIRLSSAVSERFVALSRQKMEEFRSRATGLGRPVNTELLQWQCTAGTTGPGQGGPNTEFLTPPAGAAPVTLQPPLASS